MTGDDAADLGATPWAPAGPVAVQPTATGPLDHVRVAVKDLVDIAGQVTAAGNPTRAGGAPARANAPVVDQLLAAGARIVGKTATDELAMGMFGVNTHYGTAPNPLSPLRVPGGSSSGSASVVAAGHADLGIGTDTGGSIRVPAAFCGIFGLRTTHGRIDLTGVVPMAPDFDTIGLLARRPQLLAAGLGCLSAPLTTRPVVRMVLLTDLLALASPAVSARAEQVAAAWSSRLGLVLEREPLTADLAEPDLVQVFWPLMSRQVWQSNGAWVVNENPVLGAGIRERILAAGEVTDEQVTAAREHQQALRARLATLLDGAVAVLPTTVDVAPLRAGSHADLMAYRDRNLPLVVAASLAGAPQVSCPAGFLLDAALGVSLLGLPGDDELLLGLAGDAAGAR